MDKPPVPKGPTVLCILDGWGDSPTNAHNAIAEAQTPFWDSLLETYPYSQLATSGKDVGLPEGQMGNSEVGHMNIGCGRIVMQDLPRIDTAVEDGSLEAHPVLVAMVETLNKSKKSCHIMGLLSDGGVHAHQEHIFALANIMAKQGIVVWLHMFLDGRDTPPKEALRYLKDLQNSCGNNPNIRLATICGRYYAMDRDKRWERVERAFQAIMHGEGKQATDAMEAVQASYDANITDEFVEPVVLGNYQGIQEGDSLIMANFRADRARQILQAFVDPEFDGFDRVCLPALSQVVGMVEYASSLNPYLQTLFPSYQLEGILGEVLSNEGKTQLRIAETEKYAHVTFFLSGGREEEFPGETRVLIPSPKVATYDQQPDMSAEAVTDGILAALDDTDFIVVNYANTDMVGHTGDMKAAVKAVETIDHCLSRLVPAILERNGAMLITADHGNAEMMLDPETSQPHTAHTLNPVPCVFCSNTHSITIDNGRLCDIAPTLLDWMELPTPSAMTGVSLLKKEI